MKKTLLTITAIAFLFAVKAQNVGIGETSPASKFSVKGNLSVGSGYSTTAAPADGAIIQGAVGIGTVSPDSKAALDIASTTQGVMLPRMTTVQRNAISGLGAAQKGLLIYNTDVNRTQHWNGTVWEDVGSGAGGPPTGAAGGDLTGTYPNPSVAPSAITSAKILDNTITSADLAVPAVNATNQIFNTLPVGNGGTGTSTTPINGQMLIGNGTNYSVAALTAGSGISIANGAGSVTISNSSPDQTVSITGGGINTVSGTYPNFTITGTEADGSVTNEGSLTVGAGTASTSLIQSNTSGSTPVTITAGSNITLTEAGNNITIASSNPSGTVTSVATGTGLTGGPITTTGTVSLANTAVTAGTYGSASQVGTFTVDAQGRLTSAANVTISGTAPGGAAGGDLIGTYPNPTIAAGAVGGGAGGDIADATITAADLAATGVAAGTYRSVTVNAQGQVTAGTNPTTLAGYGITDAVPSSRTITLNATANQTTVTGGAQDLSANRSWTVGTIQDIATTSNPTFNSVTATNDFIGNVRVRDTRSSNFAPNTYDNEVAFEFKDRGVVGSPGSGTYGGMITLAPWTDNSGNNHHQLFFNDGGIYYRNGLPDNASWNGWSQVLTSANNPSISGTTNYVSKFTSANTIGNSQLFDNGTNVGIGVTSPAYNLEISGSFGYGNGTPGSYRSRTESRNDAGLIASQSGFYETSTPAPAANWPAGASSWWHLLDVRHSNNTNNFAMQLAGSFFDQNLWFRKTNNSSSTAWSRVMTSTDVNGTTNYVPKFTSASTIGNSTITDDGTTVTTSSQFDVTGGTGTSYITAPIEVRTTATPRISFHWPGVVASQLGMESSGRIRTYNNPGTGYESFASSENYAYGWFRNANAGNGLYNEATGSGIYSPSANLMTLYNGSSLQVTSGSTAAGNIRFDAANPYITASSYYVCPGGAYFNSGTVYAEADMKLRGGLSNDGGNFGGDLQVNDNLRISGVVPCIQGNCAPNNVIRHTPNLHLNSNAGYAVILNWDNGTTGNTQTLRIGNGAGSDVFQVWANGNTGIGTAPSVSNMANVYHYQLTGNGDGQSAVYGFRTRDSQNDGTGYGWGATNSASSAYNFWGDVYTFGMHGHTYGDFSRTGGVLGTGGWLGSWGSLGYKGSNSVYYGVYGSTGYASGGGFLPSTEVTGIGGGFAGGVIGSWSMGEVMGQVSKGELFASYNMGNEYTSGFSADIVTVGDERMPAFGLTSTDLKVYDDGEGALNGTSVFVPFGKSYSKLLGSKPRVTVSPVGASADIYIKSVTLEGFTVASDNAVQVDFSWIAVGKRADATEQTQLPASVARKDFDKNMMGVLFNENDKEHSATPIWWNGKEVRFDKAPEKDYSAEKAAEIKRIEAEQAKSKSSSDQVTRIAKESVERLKSDGSQEKAAAAMKAGYETHPVVNPVGPQGPPPVQKSISLEGEYIEKK